MAGHWTAVVLEICLGVPGFWQGSLSLVYRAGAQKAGSNTAHHRSFIPFLFALQVLPLGASKGTGLLWLLKHLNTDPASVMALGDSENDVEMLQAVGVSAGQGAA